MFFKKLFALTLAAIVGILLPVAAGALQYQSFSFTDRRGNAIRGGDVSVFVVDTGAEAAIFDKNGVALGQPLETNSLGMVSFSAANGIYDINLSGAGVPGRTISSVQFLDYEDAIAVAGSTMFLVITDFGAIPNDGLDDSSAIQDAIDAAEDSLGATVFFPTGRWRIENTLTIQEHGVRLVGETMGSVSDPDYGTVLDFHLGSPASSGILAGLPHTRHLEHISIRDMTLYSGSYLCGHLLEMDACYEALISNVGFYHKEVAADGYSCIYIDASDTQKSSKNVVQNCRFFCSETKGPAVSAWGYGIHQRSTGSKWNTANQFNNIHINYTSSDDTGFCIYNQKDDAGENSASSQYTNLRLDAHGNAGARIEAASNTFLLCDFDSASSSDTLLYLGPLADRTYFQGRIDGHIDNDNQDPGRNMFFLPNFESVHDVRAYGAKGDASNDDTEAIKRAFYAAQVNNAADGDGGEVHFPIGTYKITTPLHVWSDGITLTGESVGTGSWKDGSVIWADFDPDDGFFPDSMSLLVHDCDHFKMDNLSFIGVDSMVTDLLVMDNVSRCIVQNSNFYLNYAYKDSAAAIVLQQSGGVTDTQYNMFNNLTIQSPKKVNDGSGAAYVDCISYGIWLKTVGDQGVKLNIFDNIYIQSSATLDDGSGVYISGRGSTEPNINTLNLFSNIQVRSLGSSCFQIDGKENSFLNCFAMGTSSDSLICVGDLATRTQFQGRTNGHFDLEGTLAQPGIQMTDAASELTITSTGYLRMPWHMFHRVDTHSGAASDHLTYMGNGHVGQILILSPADNGRTVIVDNAGSFELERTLGAFTMDHSNDSIMLVFNGTTWAEVSRSDNDI